MAGEKNFVCFKSMIPKISMASTWQFKLHKKLNVKYLLYIYREFFILGAQCDSDLDTIVGRNLAMVQLNSEFGRLDAESG